MSTLIRRRGTHLALATATLIVTATTTVGQARAAETGQLQKTNATPALARVPTQADATLGATRVDYETWQRDVRAVMDQALTYVDDRTSRPSGERQAIVLDIDNTSLETYFDLLPPTPAVKPVLNLATFADRRGVDLFFVTARPDFLNSVTRKNLKATGFPVDGLYGRSLGELLKPVQRYKTRTRAHVESKGYTIIANIGNNTSDLDGGHAERTFKLPDYGGQLP